VDRARRTLEPVRLATFNVLHGRSLDDGAVERERFRSVIADLKADVLGLQEVDRGQARSGHLDLTALAAEASGAVAHRFAPALIGTPGETYRRLAHDEDGVDEPSFGVSLISRWPVRSWHVTRLTGAPLRSPMLAPKAGKPEAEHPGLAAAATSEATVVRRRGRFVWLRDEPRVMLAAVIDGPDGPFTVATTHLSFVPAWNAGQLRLAVRALRRLPAPRLLLGDLNMPARAAALVSGWRPLARLPTFPAWEPRVQLDHVLLDRRGGARWRGEGAAETPRVPFSDHRPLIVETSAGPPPRRSGAVDY
jgi:endonuclease/exonuclease/phosphatase family metal-dependent hydrolase